MNEPPFVSLFARPLVLVAHQDDEAIGSAILLQRAAQPTVVFATDGASEDPYFWKQHGSRERLAAVRAQEARVAMERVGVKDPIFLGIIDQKLHLRAPEAIQRVTDIAKQTSCTALVTHAYEGGHPDHDTCSYICSVVGANVRIPVWEMPLYHRAGGVPTRQQFLSGEAELTLTPTAEESHRKRQMMAEYASQGDLARAFPLDTEIFRQQPHYDYQRPPHAGPLNYEAWQWTVTGTEVSNALANAMGAKQ